jgi:hypothetical protein
MTEEEPRLEPPLQRPPLANIHDPDAVLHLISGILRDKGPLPVGEVGKRLQETTSSELSVYLKETHGGLKKFLEAQPALLLGADHQFNPHVYLASSLGYEEIERVRQGETVAPRGLLEEQGLTKPIRQKSDFVVSGGQGGCQSQAPLRMVGRGLTKSLSLSDIASSDIDFTKPFSLPDVQVSEIWRVDPSSSECNLPRRSLTLDEAPLCLNSLDLNTRIDEDKEKQGTPGKSIWGEISQPSIWGGDNLNERCSFASSCGDLNENINDGTLLNETEPTEWALDNFTSSTTAVAAEAEAATTDVFNDDAFLNEHRSIFNSSF